VTAEQVPLYIDVATPHDDESPAGIVMPANSRRTGSGEVLVSGSIVGLASGEIHVDPELALAVHFGDAGTFSRKSTVEIGGEGAVMEEILPFAGRVDSAKQENEAPTPAPLVTPGKLQEAGLPEKPKEDANPNASAAPAAPEAKPRNRKRRNTLPQTAAVPPAPAAVVTPNSASSSEGYSIFSGEIEIVPEEDSPPARAARAVPPAIPSEKAAGAPEKPEAMEPPLRMGLPEEAEIPAERDAGVFAARTAEPLQTGEEGSLSPEEIEAIQRQREERREQLRRLVASLPLPFAMNLPDKTQKPQEKDFIPAVPASAMPPLESIARAEQLPEIASAQAPGTVPENSAEPAKTESDKPETNGAVPENSAEPAKTKKVATPLENSLVSAQMGAIEPMTSGRLPRASSRSDIPVKSFSDMEEEFFDREIRPENDYSGLDEVFASIQEQQPKSGLLGSLRRLFMADAPTARNSNGKPPTGAPAKKKKNGKKEP